MVSVDCSITVSHVTEAQPLIFSRKAQMLTAQKWFTTAIHNNSMTQTIMCICSSRRHRDGLASLPVTLSNGKLGEGLGMRLGMVHF